MDKINILGINVSVLTKQEILKKMGQFLCGDSQYYIITPNPEFLLRANKDEEFFYILNKADLSIPDGIGLKFASWAMGKNICRYAGADLIKDVLELRITTASASEAGQANYAVPAGRQELRIGIVNWKDGLSKKEDIEAVLKKYNIQEYFIKDANKEVNVNIEDLIKFKPDILFVNLGAPWQEKFIYHNLKKMPTVKIAIGVGGAFDFLTGKIKRAPEIMRIIGLEWLWRLIKQPWRVKRIYNAVFVFPWEFLKWKFICPFLYRPNVVCLLYKKEGNKHKVLLAERKDEPGHWQLPQGGTDGEDLTAAGFRELSEEIGCDKLKSTAVFKNLWKYKFNKSNSKYKIKRHIGYKGQKQGLYIAEFLGKDENIKINFWDHSDWKWVDSENLVNEVYEYRKKAVKIFLEKFNSIDK